DAAATEASASSASSSTIGNTTTPIASSASSTTGNCASSVSGTPADVLYVGHISLRDDSMTWSVATPTWVAPSATSWSTEPSTPLVAAAFPTSSRASAG